ncbi:helix-turn-helix domain-containing protein [Paenibacillus humicola]|uniref:helix-turn-helix domain-containing protein n=1 Tax=Paenibacillus humicola TaxID=3110540 RepID=UPI00237A44E7|nr:helix-turn-helix domain-containing protein [Paenibacillus humicola]
MQVNELLSRDDAILTLLKNRLFMDLVRKEEGGSRLFKEGLSFLNVSSTFAFPTLAVLEPSGLPQDEHERKKAALRIRGELQRQAADGSVAFLDDEGRVGLLFSWVSKEAVEAVRERLCGRLNLPVTVGVGQPCGKLSDVHHSYRQALEALEDKFYQGFGKVVYYNELAGCRQSCEYPLAKERELFERLTSLADPAGIEEAVDDFYGHLLEEGPLRRQSVDELTIRLLIGLEKRLFTEAGEESAYSSKGCEIMPVFKMETLGELKAYVCGQLRSWLEPRRLPPAETENQRVIIKKTIEYMEREYDCATLHNTAQKVYMTPTYLSALFKSNTGKTFIEQLTDIRIEKAKHMLKSTHLKNYEVAEKVGYKDSRYFSQIFKKKVGLSPSEYRETAAR